MLKPMKRSVAAVLVWLQIMMLLTVAAPQTLAVEDTAQSAQAAPAAAAMDAETEQQTPGLNPVIEGTVRFGSFNYTGDKGTDAAGDERDGVDYVSTFYYSDDYFSASAVNPNATAKVMDWSDLENLSLATLSKDFTIACYGSSENTFPTVWTNKDKNAKRFLNDCGFGNVFVSSDFNKQTGADTLGYVFGSKQITVYDQKTQQNKTFTLVAVGVRGAGYGAEWASNLTIGDSETATLANSGTYRHKGFNDGAQMVLKDLKDYTNNMTGDVKYWVVGYSRSGAIANLVAGDITKNASTYKTSIDDVYGYTFEAAAGALKTEDPNGTKYPNIHNILNKMDAVPLVSPILFNHIRLGVDYYLPYYKLTGTNDANPIIETYYNNMYNTLKKVAVIAPLYVDATTTQDPTLTDANPDTYPYKTPVQIYSFGITNPLPWPIGNGADGFVETISNRNSKLPISGITTSGAMMDVFLDSLVEKVMKSIAWDQDLFNITDLPFNQHGYITDNMTNNPLRHEWRFVVQYQEAFRTLAASALKTPGMGLSALNGISDKLMDKGITDLIGDALSAGAYYAEMHNGIRYNRAVYHLIEPMTSLAQKIVAKLELFDNTTRNSNGKTDLQNAQDALQTIMPVMTWLYCQDHTKNQYNGEYLGTAFGNVSKILVTHIPELGVSWLMSLDDVFISDYREITLPKDANISMYLFRPGIDDAYAKQIDAAGINAAGEARGALVATVNGGVLADSKDARISVSESGENVIIRYPGNLDIRFDVTATSDDVNVQLADYAPANVVNVYSTADRATTASADYNESNITDTHVVRDGIGENSVMTPDITQSAQDINTLSNGTEIPLKAGDTLQIMAWHGSNQVADSHDATYVINRIASKTCVVDFSGMTVAKNGTLKTSTASSASGEFKQNGNNVTYQLNAEKQDTQTTYSAYSSVDTASAYGTNVEGKYYYTESITAIPASSVYFDDSFATAPAFTSDGHGYSTDIDDQAVSKSAAAASGTFYYTFYGTGVDVYCTTDSESGYVSAAVFQTDDPTACSKNNRVGKAVTVSNKSSEGTRYNTPTISFMNLGEADVYTLKIVANEGAQFKLDGVRVYNPVMAGTAAAEAQAEAGEGNVVYINLHDILLNAKNDYTVTPGITTEYKTDENGEFVLDENGQKIPIIDPSAVSGVLYLDDVNSIKTTSHYDADQVWHEEELTIYKDQFDVYKNNSPKNEIYLAAADGEKKQAITFQLDTDKVRAGSPIYIGLSAPETGSGTVLVNGEALKPAVHSVIDMYYAVTVPEDGVITITNDGDSLISITNLKIPGVSNADEINSMSAADKPAAMKAFFKPMTPATVAMAANSLFSAPKANWNETANETATLLSELFRLLLQSLDTLFANVQTW